MRKKENVKKVYDGCSASYLCDGICRENHLKHGSCPCFYQFRLEQLRNRKGKLSRKYSQIFIK